MLKRKAEQALRRKEYLKHCKVKEKKISLQNQCHYCGKAFATPKGLSFHRSRSIASHAVKKGDPFGTCYLCFKGGLHMPLELFEIHNAMFHKDERDVEQNNGHDFVDEDSLSFEGGESDAGGFFENDVDFVCSIEEKTNHTNMSKSSSHPTLRMNEEELSLLNIFTKPHVVVSENVIDEVIHWANNLVQKLHGNVKIRPIKALKALVQEKSLSRESDLCRHALWRGSRGLRQFVYTVNNKQGKHTSLTFRVRDLTTVILEILSRSQIRSRGLQMEFVRTMNKDGEREYGELWTCLDWERKEARLRRRLSGSSKLLYCILYIDETTRRTGGAHSQTYTPLLLTLGNIPLDTRTKDCAKSIFGFIPCLKDLKPFEKLKVLHQFLKDCVVSQFREVYRSNGFNIEGINLDSHHFKVRAVPCVGLLLGDRPMRCAMVCVTNYWKAPHPCPACNIPGDRQDEVNVMTMKAMKSMCDDDESSDESTIESSDESEEDVLGEESQATMLRVGSSDEELDEFEECEGSSSHKNVTESTLQTLSLRECQSLSSIKEWLSQNCSGERSQSLKVISAALRCEYGLYPIHCAFWACPLLEDGTEVYSMVPADMLHDFDLGTVKDAILRLFEVLENVEKTGTHGRRERLDARYRILAHRCSSVPNVSYFEYDEAKNEHRKDLRRFPKGFWNTSKEKSWAGSDYRAMLSQVFLALGDDDVILDRLHYHKVRKALKNIIVVMHILRRNVPMTEKGIKELMKLLVQMSQLIKQAFKSIRKSRYKHPKFHSKVHYGQWVRLYGFFGNFSTESFEAWFKAGVKDASQLGNQKTDGWESIFTRLQMKEEAFYSCRNPKINNMKKRIAGYEQNMGCVSQCQCVFCIRLDCERCVNPKRSCKSITDETCMRCEIKTTRSNHLGNGADGFLKNLEKVYQKLVRPLFKEGNFTLDEFKALMIQRLDTFALKISQVTFISGRAELYTFKARKLNRRSFIQAHTFSKRRANPILSTGYEWIEIAFNPAPGDDAEWYARVLMMFICGTKSFFAVHNLHLIKNSDESSLFPHKMFQLSGRNGFDVVEVASVERQVVMVPIPLHDSAAGEYPEKFYLFEDPIP